MSMPAHSLNTAHSSSGTPRPTKSLQARRCVWLPGAIVGTILLAGAGPAVAAWDNPCATGLNPNYTSNTLTDVGDYSTYTRTATAINVTCPASGNDRKTTIVDFPVPFYYQHQVPETYLLRVTSDFAQTISSSGWSDAWEKLNECNHLKLAVRIQRWDVPTGNWVQLEYIETGGSWVWDKFIPGKGVCNGPSWGNYFENYGTAQSVATNKYRVRTYAVQPDGTYGTVRITGKHTGIY